MSHFKTHTAGERFVRLDQYGVAETLITDTSSTTVSFTSVGGGQTLISGVIGNAVDLKSLIAGTNITFDPVTSVDLTINATGGGGGGTEITTITDSGIGDVGLVKTGIAPTAVLKQLTAGTAISVVDSGDDVTVANTMSLASTGTGETLLNSTALPSFSTKSLVAGANITLTPSATELAIAAASSTVYTLADSSVSGDATLINSGAGPAFLTKRFTGATGITVSETADEVTITNAAAATTPSITSLAGDEELIPGSPQTTFTFTIKSLTAGAGIGLSSDGNAITITNTGVTQVYTLSDAAGATGSSFIVAPTPTPNDFRLNRIKAGTSISIALIGSDLTVTNTGSGGTPSVTLASAGGTSIVTDGSGPTLAVKGTGGTNLLQDVSTATQIKFDNIGIRIRDASNNMPPTTGSTSVGATGPQVAIGYNCSSSGSNGCSVGINNTLGIRGQAWGRSNTVSQLDSMAFGVSNVITTAGATQALAVGNANTVSAANAVAGGSSSIAGGARSVAFGLSAQASGSEAVAIGRLGVASATSSVSSGWGASAAANESVAFGRAASATAVRGVALGRSSSVANTSYFACGENVRANGTDAVAIGNSDDATFDFAQAYTDVIMVAGKRAGGATTHYAVHSFDSSWTSEPWWNGPLWAIVPDLFDSIADLTFSGLVFYTGGVFLQSGVGGSTVYYPFAVGANVNLAVSPSDTVGRRANEDGSWFFMRNNDVATSVSIIAQAGSGLRWQSTGSTIVNAPFTTILPAQQTINIRWWWEPGGTTITLIPFSPFEAIPA